MKAPVPGEPSPGALPAEAPATEGPSPGRPSQSAQLDSRWTPYMRRVAVLLLAATILLFLWAARAVVSTIILAAVFAFLVDPIVGWATRRLHFPRPLAALVTVLLMVLVVLSVMAVMAPILAHQLTSVGFDLGGTLKSLHQWLFDVSNSLRHFSLFGLDLDLNLAVDGFQKSVNSLSLTSMVPSGDKILGSLGGILPTLAGTLGRFVSAIGSVVVRVLLVIFFSIYMLVDMPRVLRSVRRLVPPKYHDELGALRDQVSYVAGGYFRAQVVTAIIFGTVVTLGLWALGLPSALIMGLIAMVLRLIPTLGAIIAGSISFVVALLQGSVRFPTMGHFFFALLVAALFVVMLQLDDYVVQPKIIGKRVSLPGLFVLMGVATGTAIAGILGAYLAVPTIAAFRVIFLYVHGKVTEGTVALPEAETEPEVAASSEA